MTKTLDEYIAHAAREQAERDYLKLMGDVQGKINDFVVGEFFEVSTGKKEEIITARAEQIEINMKNKLVEMLVDNDDR
ncbi:hypothetical protein [Weissella paramesenteroides]|uniref:hypothetical protein n=1 Tax=Weissella paramesenteroides TaxID=1249 RepID=UPI003D3634D2